MDATNNSRQSVGWSGGGGGGGGSSWLLNGNIVESEKSFGTLDAFGIPIIVNGAEVAKYTSAGKYRVQNYIVGVDGNNSIDTNNRKLLNGAVQVVDWAGRTLFNNTVSATSIWELENTIFSYVFHASTATPNTNVTGTFGDILIRNNASSAEMWLKQTGSATNTGWTQVGFALGYTPVNKAGDSGIGNLLFLNNNGIDVDLSGGSDVLNIGVNNANVINIGWASTVVNIVNPLADASISSASRWNKGSFGITVSGSGGVVSTGSKGYVTIPNGFTIVSFYVEGNVSGSIQFDLKNSGGTSIIGAGNKPLLSSAQFNNANVSGWTTTSFVADTRLEWVVDSATTIARCNVQIFITKTS